MKKIASILLIPVWALLLFASCKKKDGAGTTPATPNGVQIPNKFFNYSKSGGGQVAFKIKVRVQTLDGNNNATQYSSQTINVTASQNNASTMTLTGITVPSSGVFVIQLWEDAIDCHWNDNGNCSGSPTKNSYFGQQTYQAPLTNIQFTSPMGLDDWDCC